MSSSRGTRIVAWLALFVSLGGTVYAAVQIDGRTIRKGSIPANRIKRNSLTGAQVREGALATVPSAARAGVASRAAEVATAAEAAIARQAPSARTAAVAERANTAASAERATRALRAGVATDAALLGETSASGLQTSCTQGTVLAAVTVTPGVGDRDPEHPGIADRFNCTGSGIEVTRVGAGAEYEVDFGPEGVGFAVVSASLFRNVAVIDARGREGNYRVKAFNTQTDTLAFSEAFTVVLLR